MKTLLATSRVTYVPRNYRDALEAVVAGAAEHVYGLLVIDNLDFSLVKKAAGLFLLGAPRLGRVFAANLFCAVFDRRTALFRSLQKPVISARDANETQVVDLVRRERIDLVVNMRTRCLFKQPLLAAPRLGCINIHHGLLPRFRGTMCDLYALADNRPAGFSIHVMSEKLDDGRILFRKEVSAPGEKDYVAYLSKTGRQEGEALAALLGQIAKQDSLPEGTPNRDDCAAYARTPKSRGEAAALKKKGMLL
ncbi:MAG TPA: formyltransferase family protein [Chitinivibrionales bacterium]|jgi:folate-dependent phosphoribosylglycinamide formyltransferase PurN|nr:formyltransferase family protein [Chitinivibrionales bacterium]